MTTDTAPATASVILPMSALAAIAPFMGNKDVRYYLNGVLVQAARGATADADAYGTRLVATDGHMLLVVKADGAAPTDDAPESGWTGPDTIVPRALVDWALKQRGQTLVTIERNGDDVTMTAGGLKMTAPRVDGRFPDWQAVFPIAEADHAPAGFDAALIGVLAKAAIAAHKAGNGSRRHGPALTIEPAGERGARFAFAMPDALTARGVIMPLRGKAVPLDLEAVL